MNRARFTIRHNGQCQGNHAWMVIATKTEPNPFLFLWSPSLFDRLMQRKSNEEAKTYKDFTFPELKVTKVQRNVNPALLPCL